MLSLSFFNLRFTPRWQFALLSLLGILLFARLGFWQIHRAAEKQQLLQAKALQGKEAPSLINSEQKSIEPYQSVRAIGNYLPYTILLDNQHFQHQFGYDVITPLETAPGKIILIDRGWVAGDPSRQVLPEVTTPTSSVDLHGYAYFPSSKSFLLGQEFEQKEENLTLIERLDTKLIEQILHKSLYPFIIRLDKTVSDGFVREWPIVSMPPARHHAYALQWFAIAAVIFILFIALNLKREEDD